MSPRFVLESSPAGNDKTSVALSIPRNCRFKSRIRRSETKAMVASGVGFWITASARSLKVCQRSRSTRTLRCRLTTSIIVCGQAELDIALLGVVFVGADDHLHELMTHNVLLGEVNKLDPFQVGKHSFSFNQTASLACRKVDLSHIASNHRFRTKPDTREKHFHLFAGCVLCF